MTFQVFSFIFLGIALLGFYLINPVYRRVFLVLAGLIFVFFQDQHSFTTLICVTVFTYVAGIILDILQNKSTSMGKIAFVTAIAVYVALFVMLKTGLSPGRTIRSVAIPVGFSFYTFQAISYIADVYKKKRLPEKNVIAFFLYMSWFPKFVSGPIERSDNFIIQINNLDKVRLFASGRLGKSLAYIIWGLFMKLMIADRAGMIVDSIFNDPGGFSGRILVIGSLLYTIQIYCDFAGYTDIAIGISELFGIELSQNFTTPYFAENISKFWRSWHISLSDFLRDYVYIPLGGNRKGKLRKYLNLLIVFIICGFWHGVTGGFIIWGLLHGLYSVLTDLVKGSRLSFMIRGTTGKILTFCAVSFAWIFFRTETAGKALEYLRSMATSGYGGSIMTDMAGTGMSGVQLIILALSVITVFICDLIASGRKTIMPEILIKLPELKRGITFVMLAVIILVFGMYGNHEVKGFIYGGF